MALWCDRLRKKGADTRGGAAVEFALVLPVLLTILFGTIEYGWFMTWQFVLNNAVTEGARAAVRAREWEDEDPEEMAREAVTDALWLLKEQDVEAFQEKLNTSIDEDAEPRRIEVVVAQLDYIPLTGFLPQSLVPNYMSAKAVMAFP